MNIDKILTRLSGVKKTGRNKWLAKCPAHADRSPSLSIKQGDDGKILIHCFGGCCADDITGAIGLSLADLMPERPDGFNRKNRTTPPKYSPYELWPLLVQESTILALGYDRLATGGSLTPEDERRLQGAFTSVMKIHAEVSR